ncbi:MAG: diguanylate cyclase [Firmicutes bacterium]|nr:diguanylate cyclase [Bacillota bacterium]
MRINPRLGELLERMKRDLDDLGTVCESVWGLAVTDSLTGLYNRAAFEMRLGEELSRAERFGRPFSLLFIDIDDFKLCNDRFGHQAGDQVLVEVARLVQKESRSMDVVARLGGDEFIVLMPETGPSGAVKASERISRAVTGKRFLGGQVNLSISVGQATYPDTAKDPDELLRVADRTLYGAKKVAGPTLMVAQPASPAHPASPAESASIAPPNGDAAGEAVPGERLIPSSPQNEGMGQASPLGDGLRVTLAMGEDGRTPVSVWVDDRVFRVEKVLEEREIRNGFVEYTLETASGVLRVSPADGGWILLKATGMGQGNGVSGSSLNGSGVNGSGATGSGSNQLRLQS